MKKVLALIAVNLFVFIGLVVILELVLRAAGSRPLYRATTSEDPQHAQLEKTCRQLRQSKEITVSGDYFTDERGVFRAAAQVPGSGGPRAEGARTNSSGFRGREFVGAETNRAKVFFLGDSFTWGASAQPIGECFADRVDRAGYWVYNGGMPGTDPQQYALLAEIYVPRLKPDVVAVCLYLGNDLKNHAIPLLPRRNLHYATRIGFLRGYDDHGRYFADGRQAVDYFRKRKCGCTENVLEDFLYKTVVGRAVYGLFHLRGRIRPDPQRQWVVECLRRIERVCRDHGSRFLLFLIPNKQLKKNERNLRLVRSFPAVSSHYPPNFSRADYRPDPDNHFNNQGHGKFAAFILDILKAEGFPPLR
jgi:hypothetical protein